MSAEDYIVHPCRVHVFKFVLYYIFKDLKFFISYGMACHREEGYLTQMAKPKGISHWLPTQNRYQLQEGEEVSSESPTSQPSKWTLSQDMEREDQSIKLTQMKIISGKNDKFTPINGRVSDQHKAPLGKWAKASERYGKMLFIMHGRNESPDSGIYKEFL